MDRNEYYKDKINKYNSITIKDKEYFALGIDSEEYDALCKLVSALDSQENWEKYPYLSTVYYALKDFAMIDKTSITKQTLTKQI